MEARTLDLAADSSYNVEIWNRRLTRQIQC